MGSLQNDCNLVGMAKLVGSAFVEEAISQVSSHIFSKIEEKKASTGHVERLEMAHTELGLAIERSNKLPITDVSLLCRRKILKRAFAECGDVLHRCKLRALEDQRIEPTDVTVTHSSFPKRIAHAIKSSIGYLLASKRDGPSRHDVQKFERFADCANKFVRDVESGCSLWHYTFFKPLVRQLLEGKILNYKIVRRAQARSFLIWPIRLEERGVEAMLEYEYVDRKMPEKSFRLELMLRVSESIDIVGIAIKCLRSFKSQFKLVSETAMGELALLPNLQDILHHSYVPSWLCVQEWLTQLTQSWRSDPLCCKANGHELRSDITLSELSDTFSEEVIFMQFEFYIPAQEYSLSISNDEAGRHVVGDGSRPRRGPFLTMTACYAPHDVFLEGPLQSYAVAIAGDRNERIDVGIQQIQEMVKSKAIDCFANQPELTMYTIYWQSQHGAANFDVRKPRAECANMSKYNLRSKTHRAAKRKCKGSR